MEETNFPIPQTTAVGGDVLTRDGFVILAFEGAVTELHLKPREARALAEKLRKQSYIAQEQL